MKSINTLKFKHAREVFPELEQLDIDVDEIQSLNPQEVIEHKLNQVINLGYSNYFVEDVSFVIDKYGFPGPLIKWVDKTLGSDFGVYFEGESATVICLIGYCDKNKNIHFLREQLKVLFVEQEEKVLDLTLYLFPTDMSNHMLKWTKN